MDLGRDKSNRWPGVFHPRTPGGYFGTKDNAASRAILLTQAGLWYEVLARAFWPLAAVLALVWAVLTFVTLPGWGLAAAGIVVLVAAFRGVWRFRPPARGEALRRVDAQLPGRPLSALEDRQAVGEGGALWAAHQAQMAQAAQAARAVAPDAGLARRDPFGLRLMAALALGMALIFGSTGQVGQGLGALAAGRGALPAGGPSWEAWAEPPAYTRRPVIYLNAYPGDALELPQGSRISLRFYGGVPGWSSDLGAISGTEDAPELAVNRSGHLDLGDRRLAVTVQPDAPPVVALGGPPVRRADGRLVQSFTASDDNGVEAGLVRISLNLDAVDRRYGLATAPEPREPVEIALPLPGPGRRADVSGQVVGDLARHPWANLPVVLRLSVEDGIGQQAESVEAQVILPGRRFFDPFAAALIELRRDLLWSRDNAGRSAQLLRAMIWQPEGFMTDGLHDDLRGVVALLEAGPLTPDARDALAEALWQAAVQREDGGLDDALARMQHAQQKLSEAIRQGASPDEIQRLMDELSQATRDYTDMLAERGEDPAERFDRSPQQGEMLTGDRIQQMMDEIQRLMNEGRMAEAQELLQQFNRMMENLRVRNTEGEGRGRDGPSGRLADSLRQQQELADESFRRMQEQYGQQAQPGNSDEMADRQRALREELGRQRGMAPGQGTPEGDAAQQQMDRAGRAMREAEDALRRDDPGGAMDRQAEAIEAMREAMRGLDRMARGEQGQPGADQQGQGEGEAQSRSGQPDGSGGSGSVVPQARRMETDPLGRVLPGEGGEVNQGDISGALTDPGSRARDLLDEIRRRSTEPARPRDERDYLGRLLDRF
ncbi:MAG: DUF4175 family protein [Paracoccus sp. (in: a-proteobacteria)]|uniref:DUF4175 domain-containing protein n=1 Tax=Paracoccus sp. TaxID=267 RepID=UPI0026DF08E7|nr:DUF4175 family protein [Paracoccus sp. (in: a-proteobacteria)]MDO5621837.1 DUF4175 family protein [Paracoccus sp. (in: a-proteobacteria)]